MTRDEILEVVKKKSLKVLEDVKPEDFSEKKSLKELGADSLDMVEIVSSSMRELKIKIPRTKLSELKDIGGLVDLFHETIQNPPRE